MLDEAVAIFPEAGTVPAHDQPRGRVDSRHPIEAPLIGGKLAVHHGQLEKPVGAGRLLVEQRIGFVRNPRVVVIDRSAHHRLPWIGPREVIVSPVRRQLSYEARMVGLADDDGLTITGLSNDHAWLL